MGMILKRAKRASQASNRRSTARARLRVALSMQTETLPGDDALKAFAGQARSYRPHVVAATQDLSVLQAHCTSHTCYACDSLPTSVEHVPPKCLFPETKHLPVGEDLRKSLITVPACDEHNTAKSSDDEYLRLAIVVNAANNTVAHGHFKTKVLRGIERRPALMNRMLAEQVAVYIQDTATGSTGQSCAVPVDLARIQNCLVLMGRALYFHHFSKHWNGTVQAIPHFCIGLDDADKANNELSRTLDSMVDQLLVESVDHGENPQVFSYRYGESPDQGCPVVMKLSFYEGSKVTLIFRDAVAPESEA